MDDVPALVLNVLGCDGSWTGPGGAGSGYLVRGGGTTLWLDTGPGTFAHLQQVVDPATLDAVIISHHHPDHWTDLYSLETHARFASDRTPLAILAPAGLAVRTRLQDSPVLRWQTVAHGDRMTVGALSCSFYRTEHSGETLAVRLDAAGRSLGYSADSGPGWSLVDLGMDLDLVLCEATYTREHEGEAGHMSGRQAGEQARRARARRLVVTHRRPTIDASTLAAEAEAAFGGPVEQATIGKEFTL
jgi:ribonuclease BN (tRNA processing enzyme)